MSYSLQTKIQGALLGALLGEKLAVNHGNFYFDDNQISDCLKTSLICMRTIIQEGEFNPEIVSNYVTENDINLLNRKQSISNSEIAIISLPIILFYYDNSDKLHQNLDLVLNLFSNNDSPEMFWLWVYVVKTILEQEFSAENMINEVKIIMEKKNLFMPNLLWEIDNYIQEKTPLHEVSQYLSRHGNPSDGAIYQALYCFATLSEDFSLCISRTFKTTYQPELTTILVGILLGLQNSYHSIPLPWLISLQKSSLGKEINQLSENLFALWVGSYHFKINHPFTDDFS